MQKGNNPQAEMSSVVNADQVESSPLVSGRKGRKKGHTGSSTGNNTPDLPKSRQQRNSFSKKGAKDRNKMQQEGQLSMEQIVEKIIKFLPRSQDSTRPKIAVHTLSLEDTEEKLTLPPIDDKNKKVDRSNRLHKKTKKECIDDELQNPSDLAIAGVRVENSNVVDDNISVNSGDSQEAAMRLICQSPSHEPEIVNEIWVPPPGNLNKKMINTVCIFPLHTVDQSTSTDDLIVDSEPLDTEVIINKDEPPTAELEIDTKEVAQPQTPSTSMESPIIPRCLSNVEAVSRPPTQGATDTIQISRPISSARDRIKSGSRRGSTLNKEETENAMATLEAVTNELKKNSKEGNPLLQLYLYFYKDLDIQCRHHLLAAAAGISMDGARYAANEGVEVKKGSPYSIASLQGMSDLFEVVAEEVSKLEYTSYYAMQALLQTDLVINDLILIATSREELSDSFYFHLRETSNKLGEVKIAEAWVSMLLQDSRAIFTRTRALGIDPVLIGPQFSIAYQAFLSCQGSNLALKKKLKEVHALVKKYLSEPIKHAQNMPVVDNHHLEQRCEQLQERCEDLEEAMDDIKEENEELRDELRAMDSQLDRTPGAFLFYSALHNPKLPEVISHHIQVLLSVKSTIDGHDHFDFVTLKRRLEQCMQAIPIMQQFFKKYASLHKKWSLSRGKMFLDRRQIGADADSYYVCPICNIDSRRAEVELACPLVNTAPKMSSSTGALGTETKMKPKKKKTTTSTLPNATFGL